MFYSNGLSGELNLKFQRQEYFFVFFPSPTSNEKKVLILIPRIEKSVKMNRLQLKIFLIFNCLIYDVNHIPSSLS